MHRGVTDFFFISFMSVGGLADPIPDSKMIFVGDLNERVRG